MQKMRAILGFIHLCIILIIGSRLTAGFPQNISSVSGDYLRGLLSVPLFSSPRFVFVLGNIIVIVLFLKSGHSFTKNESHETIHSSYDNIKNQTENRNRNINSCCVDEQSEKQGKQSISVSSGANVKLIRRSRSHADVKVAAGGKELRRPATFSGRKSDVAATNEMSNEEFRSRVEAFIARQQRSLRDEEFSSLLVSCQS